MLITSKFPSDCNVCGALMPTGTRVSWVKGYKGASHAACSEEGKAANLAMAASRATDADLPIPCPPGLSYLGYQKAGIAYALAREGTLIGDDMGLGKTVQAAGIINADSFIQRVLIVCPASLKINWVRELDKWLVDRRSNRTGQPRLTIGIASGTTVPDTDIVIVNYDIVKKNLDKLRGPWDLVVLDEGHYIKNTKSQRTKAVHEIKGTRRVVLTGTPLPNRPIELFSILKYLDPKVWDTGPKGGFFKYAKRYANAYHNGYGWDFRGAANLEELQEKLRSTCMVRRLKADVLKELPPKRRQIVELARDGIKREMADYDRQARDLEIATEDARVRLALAACGDDDNEYDLAVKELRKCQKIAFTEMSEARHIAAVAKVPACLEFIKDALGDPKDDEAHKVIIFAHHKDVIAELMAGLTEYNPVQVIGDNSAIERDEAVQRFQNDPKCLVFIGSLTAAGVGLTLTAASHVIFVEVDWVPGQVTQAEDRAHRIGQEDSVLVQHLVVEGTIDVTMLRALVKKQEVISDALDTVRLDPELTEDDKRLQVRRKELTEQASRLSGDDVMRIHEALKFLAARCDGATQEDGAGFNKLDQAIGHNLARNGMLTPKQAAMALKMIRKYKKQLGEPEWLSKVAA